MQVFEKWMIARYGGDEEIEVEGKAWETLFPENKNRMSHLLPLVSFIGGELPPVLKELGITRRDLESLSIRETFEVLDSISSFLAAKKDEINQAGHLARLIEASR
jgi:hypothetical protein